MTITGTIPSAIANFLKKENESLNGIEIKGNDIDVILTDKGTYTELYAIGMGNGSYEIIEIDDNLDLLPEYEESDVISNDVLKKLFSTVINSSLILSFNPLGKVKYGIKDKVSDVKGKFNKAKGKINKGIDWLMDNMDIPTAQEFIRKQKGFEKAKVGRVESMPGEDGGYFKVMVGNPKDKTYSVWQLYRNGNDIRTLTADLGLDADSAIQKFDSLEGAHYDGSYDEAYENNNVNLDDYKTEEDNVTETEETSEENLNEIPSEEDNVYDEEGLKYAKKAETTKKDKRKFKKANKSDEGWESTDDGVEYKVVAALEHDEDNVIEIDSKKKKKSKYNGCNVTGYEDGTLISPMSVGDGGMAVGSSLIKNNLKLFEKSTRDYDLDDDTLREIEELQMLIDNIQGLDPVLLGEITRDTPIPYETLTINFDNSDKTKQVGHFTINVYDSGIRVTPEGYTLDNVKRRLNSLINELNRHRA